MARFSNPKEVFDRISQLREDHASLRIRVAAHTALGLAYANGQHWTTVGATPLGNLYVDY